MIPKLLPKYFTKYSIEQLDDSIWYTGIVADFTFYMEEFFDEDLIFITIFKDHKILIGIDSTKNELESKLNKYIPVIN